MPWASATQQCPSCSWVPDLGLGWSQPASIRTFHRWSRVRRFGWPGATPRSGARDIGSARCIDRGRPQNAGHGVAHVRNPDAMKPRPWRFVSEGRQLEHYADRGSPPDWRCRAALPHACTVFDPGRLDASLKPPCRTTVRPTGASVRRELPIVVGPGTAIGKLALTSAFPP
jgi:hypothetical protein